MALKYDDTINAGATLRAGALMDAATTGALIRMQADPRRLEATQARSKAIPGGDITAIRSDASAGEVRIRVAELALAGQQSDLRSIQSGISRIEAQPETLRPRS